MAMQLTHKQLSASVDNNGDTERKSELEHSFPTTATRGIEVLRAPFTFGVKEEEDGGTIEQMSKQS